MKISLHCLSTVCCCTSLIKFNVIKPFGCLVTKQKAIYSCQEWHLICFNRTNGVYSQNIFSPTEPVYHVTVPNQPSAHYGEGIMKFNPSGSVAVISPAVGNTLMEVSLMDIRRVGYMYMYNRDIVWFETCKSCKNSHELDQFSFAIVQSGTATAQTLTRNLKMAIERSTGVFLILEESTPIEMAFVSRNHYGCPCYPSMSRNRILLGGMNNSDIHGINNMFQQRASEPNISVGVHPLLRRPSEPVQKFGLSLEEYVSNPQRRTTISTSPTTPYPPVRPPKLSRGPTSLDRFRQASTSSMSSQTSVDMFEEPPSLDGVFEASLPTFRRQLSKKGSIHSRNLSQQDSISSHGSAGSTGSSPLEDHHEEIEFSMMKRVSQSRPELRPNVPPRSPASLMTRSTTPDAL